MTVNAVLGIWGVPVLSRRVPLLMMVLPLYVAVVVMAKIPAPVLIRSPVPEITPE